MIPSRLSLRHRLIVVVAGVLFISPVFADKPTKGEGGKHKNKAHHEKRHDDFRNSDDRADRSGHEQQQDRYVHEHYFNDHHRTIVREYYVDEFRSGRCPPGLAKKHNGCLPPGQAKRWIVGRPLSRDVIFYDLPDRVIRQIGYPPAGYRFVRVASDILMITMGSGMVVDAIADLSAMP